MTKDDIIRMARDAGLRRFGPLNIDCELERFANLVAAAEREACAKVCDDLVVGFPSYLEIDERIQECAAAIRARTTP